MGNPIVECIPNFSEARNPETIEEIQKAILTVPNVYILDRHSDQDHNRTVFTFIGSPDAIAEAAFQSIKKAAELIDLSQQHGEHPRIGATDVVPFVPISDITIAECVDIAKSVAQRVAEELNIPVYLYEEAASPAYPERKFLENIRRGQYETLKKEINTDASRKPDFGPNELGTAGATVIGARHPLIAFNVYLNTEDLNIAKKIAKAVRNSSGGFKYLKALGLIVNGQAQVSMNFTNFNQTPLARVVEMIRREAIVYGTSIHSSELVGLIPQKALTDAAKWYLQLHNFEKPQILEYRIYDVIDDDEQNQQEAFHDGFLTQLADASPTPGGGTALAYTAAQAAALLAMVAKSTLRKESYQKFHGLMQHILIESDTTRLELMIAMDQDIEAYNSYLELTNTASDFVIETSLSPAFLHAVANISHIPLLIAKKCVLLMDMAISAAEHGNQNALGDALNAFYLAKTAAEGSLINASINTKPYLSQPVIAPFKDEIVDIQSKIDAHYAKMKVVLQNNDLDSLLPNE
ncbi:MAG: glutamate formimidoyltransferase [Anaerolineaceae bacterium]|nr:glutamate formimidoyltransferase [Anaerolineaceae bacterium]